MLHARLVAVLTLLSASAAFAEVRPDAAVTFERDVRPIFREHCFDCHGAEEEKQGGLDLRLVRLLFDGGDSGPAIVASEPGESYLLERVRAGEMPPGEAHLSAEQVETLERWIAAGAPTARPEPSTIGPGVGISPEERSFWSFQPVRRPEVPEFPDEARVRTPIDALLLDAMQPEGLSFSPDADRRTLMLRAYFDLTGLPPTDEQAARFLSNQSPRAYEDLIDELLDSPHYGERWGRHWLDVAGYADSEGSTNADADRPWAWKYRDYVIRAFNDDKPFERFIVEQLAGDELAGPQQGDLTPEQIELLTATGYLRMAADGTGSGNDTPEGRNQVIADTIKIVTTSLLGMSVGCAQCHDHRYDPIPQTDYYAMRAVFEPALDWQSWRTPPARLVSLYTAAERATANELEQEVQQIAKEKADKQAEYITEALEKELEKFDEALRETLRTAYRTPADERTDEQVELLKQYPSVNITGGNLYQYNQGHADELKKYDARIAEVRGRKPPEHFLRVLNEPVGHVAETQLFHRGDHRQPKQTIQPAGLSVAAPEGGRPSFASNDPTLPSTGRRLAFARWLTSGEHPLVARVIVNRVWLHHFGRGIVDTPADFGRLGSPPTHSKLLDWLADEFVAGGWSLKQLHKSIMTSTAYRQSSRRESAKDAIDPDNRHLWRKSVVRIEAETLRDRMLAATGELDATLFGPPVGIAVDDAGQVTVAGDSHRRSVYIRQRRSQPVALLQAFDAPVMETNCDRRSASTVAPQSLMMMNGSFVLTRAAALAARCANEPVTNLDASLLAGLPETTEPESPWSFGYGAYDTELGDVSSFQPLPYWNGSEWQGGPECPDPQLNWAILNAGGGHPGDRADLCVVRRWTAPAAGQLTITGNLEHASEHGDGVRGRIVASRSGLASEWTVKQGASPTEVSGLEVEAGDTIDFVVDALESVTSDSFVWIVKLSLANEGEAIGEWSSDSGFHGPPSPPLVEQAARAWQLAYCRPAERAELELAMEFLVRQIETMRTQAMSLPEGVSPEKQAMTNLCQALLTSNEFLYID